MAAAPPVSRLAKSGREAKRVAALNEITSLRTRGGGPARPRPVRRRHARIRDPQPRRAAGKLSTGPRHAARRAGRAPAVPRRRDRLRGRATRTRSRARRARRRTGRRPMTANRFERRGVGALVVVLCTLSGAASDHTEARRDGGTEVGWGVHAARLDTEAARFRGDGALGGQTGAAAAAAPEITVTIAPDVLARAGHPHGARAARSHGRRAPCSGDGSAECLQTADTRLHGGGPGAVRPGATRPAGEAG